MNLLIEKLWAHELQADKLVSAEATAFVAHANDKKKLNSSKLTNRGADRTKQKFPSNKPKQLCHRAAECPC